MEITTKSPFPEASIPRVWTWIQEFRRAVSDDFSPQSIEAFMDEWFARADGPRKTWGVWRDGELCGLIVADQLTPILVNAHCLFAKRAWGHETTLPALRTAFDELFELGAEKIMGTPFAHNSQMIHLAKALGFHREGTLRGHTMQGGKPVDLALLGLLKSDWKQEREAA